MDLRYPVKLRKITTTIPEEDWHYCKNHNLQFSALIKAGVRDRKVHLNEPDAEPTMRELIKKVERLSKNIQGVWNAIRKVEEKEGIPNLSGKVLENFK